MELQFTIISLSSDNEHTDTLENLIDFVNNHPDCRAQDYSIKSIRNFANNPEPTFKEWLKYRGYDFDSCGRATKGRTQ